MKEMFLANGFNGFVSKPIILHELDEVLRECLSPEKITQRKKPETSGEDETYDSFIKDVGKIDEIDTEVGLSQVTGNKAMYRNTLEIFYQKLIGVCNDMTAFLDAKDSKNFAVSVHSMKTMLVIIGAVALSKTALELEIASKKGVIDFCMSLFGEFKGKLLSLHKQLSVIFRDGADKFASGTPASDKSASESSAAENSASPPVEETAPKAQISAKETSFTGKVLLVDDTEMILYIIGEKLSRYGLQVDTATGGKEAIDKMRNSAYDLVFMDHMMPGMDGIEATKEIRKLEKEYKKIPVIALSANTDSGVEEMFLANGFNGFLSKPIAKEKLEAIFRKWLPPPAQL